MQSFNIDIIQYRGCSYNIGYQLGKIIKDRNLLQTFGMITNEKVNRMEVENLYSTYAPHLLEELKGIADSLQISYEKALALFSGYDVPKTVGMGCSAYITSNYYVRNYDFSAVLYDGVLSLIEPDTAFANIGYNLQGIGRHEGVNSEGLVAGLHFVSNEQYCKGVSAWLAVRLILDTCRNTNEAIQLLKEIPHAASYNFSIGDATGYHVVVEASPNKVVIRSEDILTCVNHFQSSILKTAEKEYDITQSYNRNNYLRELSTKDLTIEQLFDEFRNVNSPLFFRKYKYFFGTLHTFSYDFKQSRVFTAIAQSPMPLIIDFQKWLQGENIVTTKLEGVIENI